MPGKEESEPSDPGSRANRNYETDSSGGRSAGHAQNQRLAREKEDVDERNLEAMSDRREKVKEEEREQYFDTQYKKDEDKKFENHGNELGKKKSNAEDDLASPDTYREYQEQKSTGEGSQREEEHLNSKVDETAEEEHLDSTVDETAEEKNSKETTLLREDQEPEYGVCLCVRG